MSDLPDEVELAEEYDSFEDIVHEIVNISGIQEDSDENISITVIDDEVMPEAIENGMHISQETWDNTREVITEELSDRGYTVSYAF